MIEQIRDILKDIEGSNSSSEHVKLSLEACGLIFKNNEIDNIPFKNLELEDMIIDSVHLVNPIIDFTSKFLEKSLQYLEADLKGSDFEIKCKEESKQLEALHVKFTQKMEQYQELNEIKKEIDSIQSDMDGIQRKIDEYADIDLDKIKLKKEQKIKDLKELQESEGINLKIYKKHLEENERINTNSTAVSNLSSEIATKLEEMDFVIRETLKVSQN